MGASILAFLAALTASTGFLIGLAVVVIIGMAVLLELEKEGWATTLFSLGIAAFLWSFRYEIWDFISGNPAATIGFFVTYVVIGVVWSFAKWRSYVKNIFDKVLVLKQDFISEYKEITSVDNRAKFNRVIDNSGFKHFSGRELMVKNSDTLEDIVNNVTPKASRKKSVVTSWIAYWPVSLLATLLNDPFRKFFEWVYERVSGFYDKITDHYKKDLLKA